MKKCSRCSQVKPFLDYCKKRSSKDGLSSSCKICSKKYHLDWYHKTKTDSSRRDKHKKYQQISRMRLEIIVRDYLLQHPCVDCGESDIIVLDFDHIRDKVGNISDLVRNGNKEILLREIEKCEIRCANCHRRKTAERGGWLGKWELNSEAEWVHYKHRVEGASPSVPTVM